MEGIKYLVNTSWISNGVNEVADIFRNNLVTTNMQIEKKPDRYSNFTCEDCSVIELFNIYFVFNKLL